MNRSWRALLVLGMPGLMAGGCGLLDPPIPESARVIVSGPAGANARIITSTKFVAAHTEAGTTRVAIITADTADVELPYESRHRIRGDQRFFVQAEPLGENVPGFRMQVFLDSSREFDDTGVLNPEFPFRFVYTFNQQWATTIDVVF